MARFIILSTHRDADDAITGARAQRQIIEEILAAETVNGALADIYWTAGTYDLVLVAEFADAARAAACMLAMRTELSASTTLLSTLDPEATDTALAGVRPATGRTAQRRPATGRPATGRGVAQADA
jgi:uncharacterized protein with GYD domain